MAQIDMASGHTSLLPLQESQETSLTDLELFKYLDRKRHEGSSPFCNAVLQLLQSMTGLDDFEGKNIQDVYKNQTLHGILKELTEMGACAKADIRNKKKFERDQPKVLGLTGVNIGHGSVQRVLQKTDQGTQGIYFLSDQVTPLCEFKKTEAQCQKMLGEMQSALDESRKTEWLQWLRNLGGTICEMMKAWRAYQLWIHFRLAAETDVTSTYTQFQRIFTSYFDVISNIQQRWNMQKDSLGLLISQLLECKAQVRSQAWSFEAQPPLDWNGSSKEQLHLRMFGIMKSEIDHQNVKLTVFSQSKFEERHKTRKDDFSLCGKPDKVIDCSEENGLLLHFSVGAIKKPNLKGKLHFEQMLRFSIVIELLEDGYPQIECYSVPFQVRTGSNQLWAGVGAMTWASFSKPLQMANPPFKYEDSLPVNQVVRMFRHMIWAVDQNKCFLDMETEALTGMVRGVADGGSQAVQIKKFAMDKLLGEKSEISEPFPCFTWFVAAQNSHSRLISSQGLQSEDLPNFLSESQCKQLLSNYLPGNTWLRHSFHQVDSITGAYPETRIVGHFYTRRGHEWKASVARVSKLEDRSLANLLETYISTKGEKLIHCLQPQNKSLSELSAQCKSPSHKESHNGYCRIREHAAQITILDDDMSNLSLTDGEEPSTSTAGLTVSCPSSHKKRRKMAVKTDRAPSSCAYATNAVCKPKEEVGPDFVNSGALSVGSNNDLLFVCSNLSGPVDVSYNNDPFSMGGNSGALSVGGNNDSFSMGGNSDPFSMGGNSGALSVSGNSDSLSIGGNGALSVGGSNDLFSVDGNSAALSVGGYSDLLSVGGNTAALSVNNNYPPLPVCANSAHLVSANSNTVLAGGAVTEKAALSIKGNNGEVPSGCPSGLLPVNACPSTDCFSTGFSVDDSDMIVQSGDAFPELGDGILDLLDNLDEVDFESFPPEGIPM